MTVVELTNKCILSEPNWHTTVIFQQESEKAFTSLEERTQGIANLWSLAEVEPVIQEVQEPCDGAGHGKDAVRGARTKRLHHVAANKAACTPACNKQLRKSRGYCRQNRLWRQKTVFPKPVCLVTRATLRDVVNTFGNCTIIVKYSCFNVRWILSLPLRCT
jgi:hypothetical protein